KFTEEDIRFTVKGSYLYATVLTWPEDGQVAIKSLGEKDASKLPLFHGIIKEVSALGFDTNLKWTRTPEALEINAVGIKSDYPVVLKIKID
ncbi:MAG: alpha-L-fucosidase, partial [Clostridiales bacterium]|nr:alpha-L-fucosidase [Clostridiales bacterium]